MAWGFLGPLRFRVGRSGGTVTVFGAWLSGAPLLAWWLARGADPADPPPAGPAGDAAADEPAWR
jgi:hypothetical protein